MKRLVLTLTATISTALLAISFFYSGTKKHDRSAVTTSITTITRRSLSPNKNTSPSVFIPEPSNEQGAGFGDDPSDPESVKNAYKTFVSPYDGATTRTITDEAVRYVRAIFTGSGISSYPELENPQNQYEYQNLQILGTAIRGTSAKKNVAYVLIRWQGTNSRGEQVINESETTVQLTKGKWRSQSQELTLM